MSDQLSKLFAAERAQTPSAANTAQGWKGLESALEADLPALAIAHGPLKLGLSLATKSLVGSGLLAFAVTTAGLSVHASMQAPEASPEPSADARTLVSAPAVVLPAPATAPITAPESTIAVAPATSSRTRGSAEPASTFAEELRLIKAAKHELDSGRAHLARVWLDEHGRLYPNGIFRTERAELQRRMSGAAPAVPARNFPE